MMYTNPDILKTGSCLLVIDMQNASFSPEFPCYDADGVLDRINSITELFRKKGLPVIFVQHNGSAHGEYVPMTYDWELLPDLAIAETDIVIGKTANDVFYNTDLETKLKDLIISTLIVTGAATDFCIDSTVQSALTKDYNVIVVEDAHTTGDKPHLSAEKIIHHYNWVWANLTPTKGKIEVMNCETILKEAAEY